MHRATKPATGNRPWKVLFLLLTLALLLAGAANAQRQKRDKKAKPSTFEDSTQVVQVEVPVNVVTKNGEPVTGLSAENFRVFDRGKRQELVDFEVIDLNILDVDAAEERIAELPSVARRHFLLLFDFTWSSAASIVRARQAAHDFVLNALHPTDLVGIATVSLEYGPQLLVTFTPDRAQLARAIDNLSLVRRPGMQIDPLRFMVESPSIADNQGDTTDTGNNTGEIADTIESINLESVRVIGKQIERSELNFQSSRITSWSEEIAALGNALNSVAGRKHVIYFSEGFNSELLLGRRPDSSSETFGRDMLEASQGQIWMRPGEETFGNSSLQGDINEMLDELRRADCIVQAIDVAGLRADVNQGGGSLYGRSKGSDALFYMANETGGELFEASNNLGEQLREVLTRSQVTYVLSFQPGDLTNDGSYHRLKVEVNGVKGARVSHRAGYYEPRPFSGLHPLEKSLLASDAIASATPRTEIGIDVLATPFRAGDDAAYVPVILEINGEDLVRDHRADQLSLEIYAYVTNEKGEMRDFFSQNARFDMGQVRERLKTSGVKYYGNVELGPGEHLLRVLVRNADNGRAGVATASISVPEYSLAKTAMLPPLFKDSPGDQWLLLRGREDSRTESVVYPFTINGEPFVPSARPALAPNEKVDVFLVTYNLGDGSPGVESWVVGADDHTEPAQLELVERTVTGISGQDKLLASFKPPRGLKRGDYTLEVAITDPATGSRQMGSIPFSVRN